MTTIRPHFRDQQPWRVAREDDRDRAAERLVLKRRLTVCLIVVGVCVVVGAAALYVPAMLP